MGVASLVLGILSLVFCWLPFLSWLLGLIGLILGAVGIGVGKKKGKPIGCAIAGLVMSIIGVVGATIIWILVFAAASALA